MGFLDGPRPRAFAHRGFAPGPDGAENSMAAFAAAVALGYRYLETDVRVTADGVAVAFHDVALDRVTDRRGVLSRLPWERVREARIAGREPVPLLEDVLAAWPDVFVNLDVKSHAAIGPALDALRRTRAFPRVCVGAFSDRRVLALRAALGPAVCTSLGPREAVLLGVARGRVRVGGQCAQVPSRLGRRVVVDAGYVARAHAAGIEVHVWTVNDEPEMTRVLELGVDGVMTDRADLLRDVLVRRDAWHGRSDHE